jgi:Mrp family chromosome partitioning ATPase
VPVDNHHPVYTSNLPEPTNFNNSRMDVQTAIVLLIGLAVFLYFVFRRDRPGADKDNQPEQAQKPIEQPQDQQPQVQPPKVQPPKVQPPARPRSLISIAQALEGQANRMAQPSELRGHPDYQELVSRLSGNRYDGETVLNYAIGSNWVLRCAACTAFQARSDGPAHMARIARDAGNMGPWPLIFLLDYIERRAGKAAVVTSVLAHTRHWWAEDTRVNARLAQFVKSRIAAGEKIEIGPMLVECSDEARKGVDALIKVFPPEVGRTLRSLIDEYQGTAIDREFLDSVGEFISKEELNVPVFETGQLEQLRNELLDEVASDAPRSILVVGEPGVGKSSVRREFAKVLKERGWHVFKTSAANIIADNIYVGQIEGQIRKLAGNASTKKRVALFIDRFVEFAEFGRHEKKNASLLDQLWPSIERREVFIVSETTAEGLQTESGFRVAGSNALQGISGSSVRGFPSQATRRRG